MRKMVFIPFRHFSSTLPLILVSLTGYAFPDALGTDISPPSPFQMGDSAHMYPYNVTINHLSPRSVEVSWDCRGQSTQDKYEVTLKPLEASYRVVETVPFNTCYLKLERLDPNTKYQVSVSAISGKVRKRSSSVIFQTYMELEDYGEIIDDDEDRGPSTVPSTPLGNKDRLHLPSVRLVEIFLVCLALVLWAGAIVLFFHRWGKIRMLLPYQPDYKEMKRSTSVCANCSMTPHHQCCRVGVGVSHQLAFAGAEFMGPIVGAAQVLSTKADLVAVPVTDTGCSPIRPRFNSFVIYDVGGRTDSKERKLGRKTKSAENLEHPMNDYAEEDPSVAGDFDRTTDVSHSLACTEC